MSLTSLLYALLWALCPADLVRITLAELADELEDGDEDEAA